MKTRFKGMKKIWKYGFLLFISLIFARISRAQNGSLCIWVNGYEDTGGDMLFSLYNQADGWPSDRTKIYKPGKIMRVSDDEVMYCYRNLPYGSYAVAVLYDINHDGDMNYNFFGLPTEEYGFSNNPRVYLSAPSFERCKVILDKSRVQIEVNL